VHNRIFGNNEVKRLFAAVEENIVSRVRLKLSLANSASRGWSRPAFGVQALHESGFGEKLTAGWPFLIADGLQQETRNRSCVRATRVGSGIDVSRRNRPHLARIKGTLPCRVPAEWHWLGRVIRMGIDAGEVSNDLYRLAEESRKQGGFRTWGIHCPGGRSCRRGQACVALASECMPLQEWGISDWRPNIFRRSWECCLLRSGMRDSAKCTSQQ